MEQNTLYKLRLAINRLLRDAETFDELFFGVQDLRDLIEEANE